MKRAWGTYEIPSSRKTYVLLECQKEEKEKKEQRIYFKKQWLLNSQIGMDIQIYRFKKAQRTPTRINLKTYQDTS